MSENAYRAFIERYRGNTPALVREVFGDTPEPWQDDALIALDRGDRRISIRSGHGVGKSTYLSWAMLRQLLLIFPQKTVVTAPTSTQLWDALWAEFKSRIERLPPYLKELLLVKQERVELLKAPADSFATARTSRAEQPDALQGVHPTTVNGIQGSVLLIADEGAGIPDPVYEAASGSMSGHNAVTILAGNPTRGDGFFYRTHHELADMWTTFHVPCTASRFVSPDYIEDMRRRYGEDSNAYRVRVLGEFPLRDDDTVIPFELVEAAVQRDITRPGPESPTAWGVDCARFGSDRSALAKRRTFALLEPVRSWHGLDTMQLAARVRTEYEATPLNERPVSINVDVIGIGAGVVDRLRELGLPVRGVNVSEAPAFQNADRFRNLRADLWFRGREWFARMNCTLPKQDDLIAELTTVRYKWPAGGGGKVQIESKDDLKKRGRPSPNLADAFLLTFATDDAMLTSGSRLVRTRARGPYRMPHLV